MRPSLTSSDFRHTKESEEAISSPSLKRARSPIRRCSTPFAGQLSADGVEGGPFDAQSTKTKHVVYMTCMFYATLCCPSLLPPGPDS